jgi:hypothetical protein
MRQEFVHLIRHSPEGYRFIQSPTASEGLAQRLSRYSLSYEVYWQLLKFLPIQLAKPFWERFKRLPPNVDITYAVVHPVFRREPWVLDMRLEQPHLLLGSEAVFQRWKWLLQGALTSPYCRKIISELKVVERSFLQLTGWHELEPKMAVVHSSRWAAEDHRLVRRQQSPGENAGLKTNLSPRHRCLDLLALE